jgi:uncharacterized protein YlxW (UPF0749 family)
MKTNKILLFRIFIFFVLISLFSESYLFAQTNGGEEDRDNSVSIKELNEEIAKLKNDIEELNESNRGYIELINKINSENASITHVLQIISSLSEALIALSLIVFIVFFLLLAIKYLKTHKQTQIADVNETKQKEHSTIAEADYNTLKNKIDEVRIKLTALTEKIETQIKEAARFETNLNSLRNEMSDNKQKILSMEAAVSSLKTDIDKDKEKLTRKEEIEKDPIAVFNKWAQNPSRPLPEYFSYVTIFKPEFRTKQDFTDTDKETDWIRNTIGEKKYLFPNPNKIDNLSGPIDKLYNVEGTRKGQGLNSIKIINACQIKEGNFIEYKGDLVLL